MVEERNTGGKKGCPVCGKPPAERHRPFCSPRCADIDLGRWFRESYRIPSAEPAPDAAESLTTDETDDDRREH